jgi:tetratricopeptide (TPR) repeat protein
MGKKICCLFFLLLGVFDAMAAEKATLLKISKKEGLEKIRIFLEFSALPAYRVKTSGQRIDLIFPDTTFDSAFKSLPEDGTIVKSLLKSENKEIVVSLLLRRPPQQVDASVVKGSSQLVLDIFWENRMSTARPAITNQVAGVTAVHRNRVSASRSVASAYSGQWETFFTGYEVPVKMAVPLRYSLPPFPCRALFHFDDEGRIPPDVVWLGEKEAWDEISSILHKAIAEMPEGEKRDRLLLIQGEVLVRSGAFDEALNVLKRLIDKHPGSNVGECARYLVVNALAAFGDPYAAAYELSLKKQKPAIESSLTPYFHLLQAEIALATEQHDEALKSLTKGDATYSGSAEDLHLLRLADVWAASGQEKKAFEAYRKLQERPGFFKEHPFSLAGFAGVLYRCGEYRTAAERYKDLAVILGGQPEQDLAFFAAAMGQLKSGDTKLASLLLKNITETFPGTEGDLRARLKVNDLEVLSGKEGEGLKVAINYGEIAGMAPLRELREEAAFKQALTLHFKGEDLRSVQSLQVFLRDYGRGRLCNDAEALLVELLPKVIKDLIEEEGYLQVLVLVEKNRELFANGKLSRNFLSDLGRTFVSLGFLDRAARVYLYMLDFSKDKAGEEEIYLPLVQILHDIGESGLVEDYVDRYFARFPSGKDRSRLYYLWVSSLKRNGRSEEAAGLLSAKGRPESRELNVLAGHVYWDLGKYDEVDRYLAKVMDKDLQNAVPEEVFLRAEALLKGGKERRALPFYQHLVEDSSFSDQAAYRCAQIYLSTGKSDEALKLLQSLAEKGNNPLWRKMAEETLAVQKL